VRVRARVLLAPALLVDAISVVRAPANVPIRAGTRPHIRAGTYVARVVHADGDAGADAAVAAAGLGGKK
jgi:hypothetical protein